MKRLHVVLWAAGVGALLIACSSDDCSASGTCVSNDTSSDRDGGAALDAPASGDAAPLISGDAASTPFDPSRLRLTGWWRADFAGVPWPPTESAGTSATNGSWESSSAPVPGAPQNAFRPVDFAGAQALRLDTPSRYVTPSAWSFVMLVRATTAEALRSHASLDCGLIHDATAAFGVSFGTDTGVPRVQAYVFDGTQKTLDISGTSWKHGAYVLVQVKHDGVTLRGRVNGDVWSSVPAGPTSQLGSLLIIGEAFNLAAPFLNGSVLEVLLADRSLSDADFDGVRAYASARYRLAL